MFFASGLAEIISSYICKIYIGSIFSSIDSRYVLNHLRLVIFGYLIKRQHIS